MAEENDDMNQVFSESTSHATEISDVDKVHMNKQEHSFLMDQIYVEEMEDGLLKLLSNFKKGKLNAFDEKCSLDKMKQIKTLQERLAQLHFDLESDDGNKTALSEDERAKRSQEKMDKLMESVCLMILFNMCCIK